MFLHSNTIEYNKIIFPSCNYIYTTKARLSCAMGFPDSPTPSILQNPILPKRLVLITLEYRLRLFYGEFPIIFIINHHHRRQKTGSQTGYRFIGKFII